MTRFARARGSKSSNERVVEQATSWSEMRRDLHRESVRKAAEEQIERESHSDQRQSHGTATLATLITKTKVKEPAELAPFDPMPRFGESSRQTTANSQTCVGKKASKINIKKVPKDERVHSNVKDNWKNSEPELSRIETQVRHSANKPTALDEIKPFKIPSDPAVTESFDTIIEKLKNANPKPKFPSQGDKLNFPTNSQKLQSKKRPLKEDRGEDAEIQIGGNFKGYPVPKEDAETLTDAYNILRKEGLTHQQAMERIKPERRRAEKRLARLKSIICFRCRKPGHRLSDCPMGDDDCDVCFKCGSTTHKYQDCKKKGSFVNAKCFICGVVGHLSAQCPESSHGVYPEGGECKVCGAKTHLVKDCPANKNKKDHHAGITEFDDYFDEKPSEVVEPKQKKIKKVQF